LTGWLNDALTIIIARDDVGYIKQIMPSQRRLMKAVAGLLKRFEFDSLCGLHGVSRLC